MEMTSDRLIKEVIQPDFAAFREYALEIFRYQYLTNVVYRQFCDAIQRDPSNVKTLDQLPFLPIQFFKTRQIISTNFEPKLIFESSGTTGSVNSRHILKDPAIYRESFLRAFQIFFGQASQFCILGLLPSYLERENSSLVFMVNDLIRDSGNPNSGFYLYDHKKLAEVLLNNEKQKIPTILFGVTYALLDFANEYSLKLEHTIIVETGGMKGRKKELTREEVHHELMTKLGLNSIYSEYGMTELLSQAYSIGKGIFKCPPWMKIVLREDDDPFEIITEDTLDSKPKSGAVNIIDLANLHSCSFIATDDFGRLYRDGSFEIMGRLDNSDVRGCGLMIL